MAASKRVTRRSGRADAPSDRASIGFVDSDLADDHIPSLSFSGSTRRLSSPYLPTTPEIFLFLVYPTILLVGSIFGAISLPTRLAPYSPLRQSFYPTHLAPSYFALKKNIFNVFFVKIGWFWVTSAFAVFWILHSSHGPAFTPTEKRLKALLRWGCVTGWWFIVSQWCFGPPLIDRGFRLTGGKCLASIEEVQELGIENTDLGTLATAAACRLAGGKWAGGHDISGHFFLLVLGSAFLSLEILPSILRGRGMTDKRALFTEEGRVIGAAKDSQLDRERARNDAPAGIGKIVGFSIGVILLSWWMLLMTAIYFHTWFEKVSVSTAACTFVANQETDYRLPHSKYWLVGGVLPTPDFSRRAKHHWHSGNVKNPARGIQRKK